MNICSPSLLHLLAELPLRLPTDASLPQRPTRSGRDPKPHASDFFCSALEKQEVPIRIAPVHVQLRDVVMFDLIPEKVRDHCKVPRHGAYCRARPGPSPATL